jgi:hypothetical protein
MATATTKEPGSGTIIIPMYIQGVTEVILPPIQNIVGVC